MGKQPRPRPAAGSEEERIRDLTRELHEHIKEGREVTRELRAAEADANLARARLNQAADDATSHAAAVIQGLFDESAAKALEVTGKFHAEFRTAIAGLSDLPTGEALIERVTTGLAGVIRPIVDEAIGRAIEYRLNQVMTLTGPDDNGGRRGTGRSGLSFPNTPGQLAAGNAGGTGVPA